MLWKMIAGFLTVIASLSGATATHPTSKPRVRTAEKCGVDVEQPPLKSFANFNGTDGWREYRTVKDIPELYLSAGSAALYWTGSDGKFLILMQEPGEDFNAYTHLCFARTGNLTELRYELRTAWGWGFREEGTIRKNKFLANSSEFFDTGTEQPIPKPEMADEIPAALQPQLYLTKSMIPFAQLLPK